MKFYDLTLYGKVKTSEDELGNSIYKRDEVAINKGALTQWTKEDVDVLGRPYTENNRKLLTQASIEVLSASDEVHINGEMYKIVSIAQDFIRWRLCHIRKLNHVD